MVVTTSWLKQTEMNRSLEKKFEREGEIKKAIQIQIWIKWEKKYRGRISPIDFFVQPQNRTLGKK